MTSRRKQSKPSKTFGIPPSPPVSSEPMDLCIDRIRENASQLVLEQKFNQKIRSEEIASNSQMWVNRELKMEKSILESKASIRIDKSILDSKSIKLPEIGTPCDLKVSTELSLNKLDDTLATVGMASFIPHTPLLLGAPNEPIALSVPPIAMALPKEVESVLENRECASILGHSGVIQPMGQTNNPSKEEAAALNESKRARDEAKIAAYDTQGDTEFFCCPICDMRQINGKDKLTAHLRDHQMKTKRDDGKHVCCLCGHELSSNSSLERHLLTHTNYRPFDCNYCNKSFTTNGNLSRHIKTTHEAPNVSIPSNPSAPVSGAVTNSISMSSPLMPNSMMPFKLNSSGNLSSRLAVSNAMTSISSNLTSLSSSNSSIQIDSGTKSLMHPRPNSSRISSPSWTTPKKSSKPGGGCNIPQRPLTNSNLTPVSMKTNAVESQPIALSLNAPCQVSEEIKMNGSYPSLIQPSPAFITTNLMSSNGILSSNLHGNNINMSLKNQNPLITPTTFMNPFNISAQPSIEVNGGTFCPSGATIMTQLNLRPLFTGLAGNYSGTSVGSGGFPVTAPTMGAPTTANQLFLLGDLATKQQQQSALSLQGTFGMSSPSNVQNDNSLQGLQLAQTLMNAALRAPLPTSTGSSAAASFLTNPLATKHLLNFFNLSSTLGTKGSMMSDISNNSTLPHSSTFQLPQVTPDASQISTDLFIEKKQDNRTNFNSYEESDKIMQDKSCSKSNLSWYKMYRRRIFGSNGKWNGENAASIFEKVRQCAYSHTKKRLNIKGLPLRSSRYGKRASCRFTSDPRSCTTYKKALKKVENHSQELNVMIDEELEALPHSTPVRPLSQALDDSLNVDSPNLVVPSVEIEYEGDESEMALDLTVPHNSSHTLHNSSFDSISSQPLTGSNSNDSIKGLSTILDGLLKQSNALCDGNDASQKPCVNLTTEAAQFIPTQNYTPEFIQQVQSAGPAAVMMSLAAVNGNMSLLQRLWSNPSNMSTNMGQHPSEQSQVGNVSGKGETNIWPLSSRLSFSSCVEPSFTVNSNEGCGLLNNDAVFYSSPSTTPPISVSTLLTQSQIQAFSTNPSFTKCFTTSSNSNEKDHCALPLNALSSVNTSSSSHSVSGVKKKNSYKNAPKLMTCPWDGCHQKFPWQSSLKRHLITHIREKPYKCTRCTKSFSTKSNRERHMERVHHLAVKRTKRFLQQRHQNNGREMDAASVNSGETETSLTSSNARTSSACGTGPGTLDSRTSVNNMENHRGNAVEELNEEEILCIDVNDKYAENISNTLLKEAGQPVVEPNPERLNAEMQARLISSNMGNSQRSHIFRSTSSSGSASNPFPQNLLNDLSSDRLSNHLSTLSSGICMTSSGHVVNTHPIHSSHPPLFINQTINGSIQEVKTESHINGKIVPLPLDRSGHSPLNMMNDSSSNAPYQCSVCTHEFIGLKELNFHMRTIHTNFRCVVCSRSYVNRIEALEHLSKAHPSEWNVILSRLNCHSIQDLLQCFPVRDPATQSNVISEVGNIEIMKTDMEDMQVEMSGSNVRSAFVCSICLEESNTLQELQRHHRTHSGAKPFFCPTCNKEFSLKHSMQRHMRCHTTNSISPNV